MLFEIKPVALTAMVAAVVAGVALRSVHSVPAVPFDTPVINENDATIGQVRRGSHFRLPSPLSRPTRRQRRCQ